MKNLTKKQMEKLLEKIISEKERVLNKLNVGDEKVFTDKNSEGDEIDQANADLDSAQTLRFRSRDIFYLKKLDKSLVKIDENDDYGCCDDCGENIRFERLIARPTAELCIHCKEESEREETSNYIGRQSKSFGKAIDLVSSL